MKIAVIVEGKSSFQAVSAWLSYMKKSHTAQEITILRVPDSSLRAQIHQLRGLHPGKPVATMLSFFCIKLLEGIESFASRFSGGSQDLSLIELSRGRNINEIDLRNPVAQPNGKREISREDVELINSLAFDLIVVFGMTLSFANLRLIPTFGLLERVHENRGKITNRFPGLTEVVSKADASSYLVIGYLGSSRKKQLFGAGATQVHWSLRLTRLISEAKSGTELGRVSLQLLRSEGVNLTARKGLVPELEENLPNLRVALAYLTRFLVIATRKFFRRLTSKTHPDIRDDWHVGYKFGANWPEIELSGHIPIENPDSGFYADPFLFEKDGNVYCFVEEFSHKSARGRLSVFQIDQRGHEWLGVAIEENFHLSFPYVFEWDGQIFMCPETSAIREIRLYRCIDFPLKWELAETLMTEVSAADSLLFRHQGLWWLATNICSPEIGDHTSELHLFSSPHLLDGIWRPHPLNPVINDSRYARNGGFLMQDDRLFRFSQKQGFDNYGEELCVAHIECLSRTSYSEVQVARHTSKALGEGRGIHTLSIHKNMLAFDFRKALP